MNRAKPYILLAEDDLEDQEMIHTLMKAKYPDIGLVCVPNGREVIRYLEGCDSYNLPSLLLIDYNMPIMGAPPVLDHLQQHSRYMLMSRIVWSGSANPAHAEECLALGAVNYFLKPHQAIQLENMMEWIMSYLDFQQRLTDGTAVK